MGEKDKKMDADVLNTMFTLLANFSSEEQSKLEEIKAEYKEREYKAKLEHDKQIASLNGKSKIASIVIGILGCIIITLIIVFGALAYSAIDKHYEMDKILQEDIIVEFETEWTEDEATDTFGDIEAGDNALIGSTDNSVTLGDGASYSGGEK